MTDAQILALTPGSRPHRGEPRPLGRHDPIGVLDVGTTKMCCLIARRGPGGRLEVRGAGYQLAEGLRAGEIVDAEAAEASILAVVHEAEQQAKATLREVVVGISAGRPRSERAVVELDLERRAVTGDDLARALAHARAQAHADGRETLHALPLRITLDGGQPVDRPKARSRVTWLPPSGTVWMSWRRRSAKRATPVTPPPRSSASAPRVSSSSLRLPSPAA